jgi:putative transcriptional regulator
VQVLRIFAVLVISRKTGKRAQGDRLTVVALARLGPLGVPLVALGVALGSPLLGLGTRGGPSPGQVLLSVGLPHPIVVLLVFGCGALGCAIFFGGLWAKRRLLLCRTQETRRLEEQRMEIRNTVKELREERGISREGLAEQLRINPRTLGYIEQWDYVPSLELAWTIADYFGLPFEQVWHRRLEHHREEE